MGQWLMTCSACSPSTTGFSSVHPQGQVVSVSIPGQLLLGVPVRTIVGSWTASEISVTDHCHLSGGCQPPPSSLPPRSLTLPVANSRSSTGTEGCCSHLSASGRRRGARLLSQAK